MIAFDLDGVLLSDVAVQEDETLEARLFFRHNHVLPVFCPSFPYYIITGRPLTDEKATKAWLENNLKRQPDRLFMGNDDLRQPHLYKIGVLNRQREITTYVESDDRQAALIQGAVNCEVIHFSAWLNDALKRLST